MSISLKILQVDAKLNQSRRKTVRVKSLFSKWSEGSFFRKIFTKASLMRTCAQADERSTEERGCASGVIDRGSELEIAEPSSNSSQRYDSTSFPPVINYIVELLRTFYS